MSLHRTYRPQHRNRSRNRLHLESLERRQLLALVTADFSDLTLESESFWHGPDPSGVDRPADFDTTERVGKFTSGGVDFQNVYNLDFGTWSSFAYSNVTDNTTPGFTNEHSAFTGSGRGDANYGVSFGQSQFTLPAGAAIHEVYVTNNTYTALSMLNGDGFAKKFGGADGNDPDFYKLTAWGVDAEGTPLPGSVEIYLADYRFENNAEDYVVDEWVAFDLSALAGAKKLHFEVTSSDVGPFGMNTPAYFAIDDVTFDLPNTAPVLDHTGSPQLAPVLEDATASSGTLVQALLAGAVTDPDAGAQRGIAIVAADTASGAWEYTLDGGANWQPLPSPAMGAARLLPADALTRVRFLPQANFNGQASLTYHAWDQTSGTAGGIADLSIAGATGGTTAFSVASETASQSILAVNDAPVLDTSPAASLGTIREDATNPAGKRVSALVAGVVSDIDANPAQGIAVIGASRPTKGTWQYSLDDGESWSPMSPSPANALLLPATTQARVRFVPHANFTAPVTLWYRAWDLTQASTNLEHPDAVGGTTAFSAEVESAQLTILAENDAPVLTPTEEGTVGYARGTPAVRLLASAIVSDPDGPDYVGAKLIVRMTDGHHTTNRLVIGGGFVVEGNDIKLDGVVVATRNAGGGEGLTRLEVSFRENATRDIVQRFVRGIKFRTHGPTTTVQRGVEFTLLDSIGAASNRVEVRVNVT